MSYITEMNDVIISRYDFCAITEIDTQLTSKFLPRYKR